MTTFDRSKAIRYTAGKENLTHFKVLGLPPDATLDQVVGAVHAFQLANGLDADGMAGPDTLCALFVADGCRPPPRAPFKMPRNLAEMQALYGCKIVLHPNPDNAARLRPGAELDKGYVQYKFKVRGGLDPVTLHKSVGPHIQAAYDYACEVSDHRPKDVQGTVCRRKNWDPDADPSTHSVGAAIDCDPPENGRNDQTPALPQRFFSAMRACGAICGRDFGQPEKPRQTDPMHFQWVTDAAINAIPIV